MTCILCVPKASFVVQSAVHSASTQVMSPSGFRTTQSSTTRSRVECGSGELGTEECGWAVVARHQFEESEDLVIPSHKVWRTRGDPARTSMEKHLEAYLKEGDEQATKKRSM